jgi:hypothetical protein
MLHNQIGRFTKKTINRSSKNNLITAILRLLLLITALLQKNNNNQGNYKKKCLKVKKRKQERMDQHVFFPASHPSFAFEDLHMRACYVNASFSLLIRKKAI